jgi:branched-chain amino acid transport system substrate-binding protein
MQNFGARFYLIGSNYVFPYESNRIIRDYISSHGGKVVEERYIPLNAEAEDLAPVIADIRKCAPSVIISTVVGDTTADFYRAYRKAGFDPATMPIGSLTTCEPEVQRMGAEAAEGHYTSAPYFRSISAPENQRFVATYSEKFGPDAPISSCTEAAYFQVQLFARAVERAGSTQIAAIKEALPGCLFSAPQGAVRVDRENNHTYLWPRIGRVDASGQFEVVEESGSPVKPDPYLITPEDETWAAQAVRSPNAPRLPLTGNSG